MSHKRVKGDERILRLPEVIRICGIQKSTIRRYELAGQFPQRVKLGVRSVEWKASDIYQWLEGLYSTREETV